MHAYRAILHGAEVAESWHEASIWVMPNGHVGFTRVPARSVGAAGHENAHHPPHGNFHGGSGPQGDGRKLAIQSHARLHGSNTVFVSQHRLQRGHEENHVLAFDVSKAFDTAPQWAPALLVRHMGVPEELIKLFHTLTCGSTVHIVSAHGPTPSIRLPRGLRQGSAESAVLSLLLLEPLLWCLASKPKGDTRYAVPPLVQT